MCGDAAPEKKTNRTGETSPDTGFTIISLITRRTAGYFLSWSGEIPALYTHSRNVVPVGGCNRATGNAAAL